MADVEAPDFHARARELLAEVADRPHYTQEQLVAERLRKMYLLGVRDSLRVYDDALPEMQRDEIVLLGRRHLRGRD